MDHGRRDVLSRRSRTASAGLLAGAAVLAASVHARAADTDSVVIWPTLTPAGDAASAVPMHKPSEGDKSERDLAAHAQELDATLRDAVQDLGFRLFVADAGPAPGHARDEDLIERAARSGAGGASGTGTWVVSPRLEESGGEYVLRIVVVAPNGRELHVRVDTVTSDAIAVRGLVMMRDLLAPTTEQAARLEHEKEGINVAHLGVMAPLRSQGRAVLGVNSALFGGFLAYSIQRSSGSDDPRVLYPLLALGTGIGIGAALLVADEWDVTTGDAWFLSAGAWWGAASGILIANGQHLQPFEDRYAWGVAGGFLGLGLATFAEVRYRMDEGDAMLVHSGGALGLFYGGLAELLYRGQTTDITTPYTGTGFGSGAGLLIAGALATQIQTSPSRVLLVDLGAGIGALAGAAAGSPFIFQNVTENRNRDFLAATLAGSLVGGGVALFLTRGTDNPKEPSAAWTTWGAPTAGVIGTSVTPTGSVPAYGIGWQGRF